MELLFLKNLHVFEKVHVLEDNNFCIFPNTDLSVKKRMEHSKKNLNPLVLKIMALECLNQDTRIKIYMDASKGVSEDTSIAFAMNDREFNCKKRIVDRLSFTSAELNAIKLALESANKNNLRNLLICTDSLSSCIMIENSKRHLKIEKIFHDIFKLSNEIQADLMWLPSHVGIVGNEIADSLAKEALSDG
jgi:kelch-like protein 2/3